METSAREGQHVACGRTAESARRQSGSMRHESSSSRGVEDVGARHHASGLALKAPRWPPRASLRESQNDEHRRRTYDGVAKFASGCTTNYKHHRVQGGGTYHRAPRSACSTTRLAHYVNPMMAQPSRTIQGRQRRRHFRPRMCTRAAAVLPCASGDRRHRRFVSCVTPASSFCSNGRMWSSRGALAA